MNNLNLLEAISKGVSAKEKVQLKVEYTCESKEEMEVIASNITKLLVDDVEGVRLAKVTYDMDLQNNIVTVEFIQHN